MSGHLPYRADGKIRSIMAPSAGFESPTAVLCAIAGPFHYGFDYVCLVREAFIISDKFPVQLLLCTSFQDKYVRNISPIDQTVEIPSGSILPILRKVASWESSPVHAPSMIPTGLNTTVCHARNHIKIARAITLAQESHT